MCCSFKLSSNFNYQIYGMQNSLSFKELSRLGLLLSDQNNLTIQEYENIMQG
jgi:hypothetical protein